MSSRTPVAVLGLGRMGTAYAELFQRNGNPVAVWNRTPGRADALASGGGVTVAATPAEAVAAARLVLTAQASAEAVHSTLEKAAAVLPGRTVLNLTTGRPDQARDLGAYVESHGGRYLDGGVFGVPQTVGGAESLTVYSGSAPAQEEHGELLKVLGGVRYLGEDHGLASLHDMAVLGGMYGLFAGFFQAAAMVRTQGVEAGAFTESLLVPWLAEIVGMLPALAKEIDSGEYPVTFSDLAVNHTGLADIRRTAVDTGVGDRLLAPLGEMFAAQLAKGHGTASFSRAVEELRAGADGSS